ncbi:hypothetical protein QUF74_07630 [Candidatus Halobeggiatoa sp. HSG11]|nr:hypothetical protein [Candidatus Halobeggiatoa sp. HSG11]
MSKIFHIKCKTYIWLILAILLFGSEPMLAASTEQPTIQTQSTQQLSSNEQDKKLPLFYIIGIMINIVMFTLVIIWAVKEWRKTSK